MLRFPSALARPAGLFVAALLLNACSPATDAPETAATPPLPPIPPATGADAATAAPAGAEAAVLAAGQALFAQNCAICHGADGKLGVNGARDLTKSNLNATGRTYMVVNGLGVMPAFKGQLTDEQIAQVVAYSLTLK
ncbi:c-type cytochrome [Hymenobacter actinosclerus]|uniref:Cytochrome c6 n=1 Tax=Hymenobacter actinosclerus TaxID=82805 RepID=A0A1H9ZHK5_9BACT|nr:cytochrome c [Hymenobacter actinosclerus]SES81034.1 cytochrome c6 [Hymenobacter actinosclerus]